MPLIKSISGIRGTIGSKKNENLTPEDIKSFTVAFGEWVKSRTSNTLIKIVVGRDARKSGEMINSIVNNNLISLGINVVDLGLSTTPTVEMMVLSEKAQGGIVITASHNPKEWNALKFLNNKGECLSASSILDVINRSESISVNFPKINELGSVIKVDNAIDIHISSILNLSIINSKLIRNQKYSKSKKIKLASKKEIRSMVDLCIKHLDQIDFFKPKEKKPKMIQNLLSLFYRIDLSQKETRILSSVFASLAKKGRLTK